MTLAVFPTLPGLGWPVKVGIKWDDDEQDAISGKRVRVPHYSFPIYEYELTVEVLQTTLGDRQALQGFINSVNGPSRLWAFTDPDDSSVSAQEFGEGDGTTVGPFQLVRSIGGFTEPVFLVNGTPQIFVAGVLKTPGTDYTISAYGVVTFLVAPANGALLTWTGSYFWPCRFDKSVIQFVKLMSGLYQVGSLKFSTEKLP
jgi:hypothetical protein